MKTLEIAEIAAPSYPKYISEAEFVEWCDEDSMAEFVDGEVIVHSPASVRHERISTFLGGLLLLFIDKHNLGQLFSGGHTQIRLRPGLRRMPDIIFISKSRSSVLCKNHIEGAPDLVVEIVSPDSLTRDWRDKYFEYEEAGVKEYWIIDPLSERMDIYSLTEGGNYELILLQEGILHSRLLPGFWLNPHWLWQEPQPNVLDIARELKLI